MEIIIWISVYILIGIATSVLVNLYTNSKNETLEWIFYTLLWWVVWIAFFHLAYCELKNELKKYNNKLSRCWNCGEVLDLDQGEKFCNDCNGSINNKSNK